MKGDRFEQIVEKQTRHDDWGIAVVSADQVLALLRKEHAAVKRMVEKRLVPIVPTNWLDPLLTGPESPIGIGKKITPDSIEKLLLVIAERHNQQGRDILAALDRRAKGGTK